jgi:hypothetical protein
MGGPVLVKKAAALDAEQVQLIALDALARDQRVQKVGQAAGRCATPSSGSPSAAAARSPRSPSPDGS